MSDSLSPLKFQTDCATQIAARCVEYLQDPLTSRRDLIVPYLQTLTAITGSGKTLILAEAIEYIRAQLPVEPIVLWLSRGRIVVWQTLTNLTTGKYAARMGGFAVKPLLACRPEDVADASRALALVATVGKFNTKDRELGGRKIFSVRFDSADSTLWQLLAKRETSDGVKRPLIVVYDEGHNLSDQQTALLLDLAPEALIAASATPRWPAALGPKVERFKQELSWTDENLASTVSASAPVSAGLIVRQVVLAGEVAPMHDAVAGLMDDFRKATQEAADLELPFRPKAIYISTTNTVDGTSAVEDARRPFTQREARPIKIWRRLVEHEGVDPREIAVYCDLRFDRAHPPPPEFNLFAGGDADYDRFTAGSYRHIIFNLALQEGWDDPACMFAYIDKEMGSATQVTQIVGRVLRQPGGRHYPPAILNTAHFYLRHDDDGVIRGVIDEVANWLAKDAPDVRVRIAPPRSAGRQPFLSPKKTRTVVQVEPYAKAAKRVIAPLLARVPDYRGDSVTTVGPGKRIRVLQTIGDGSNGSGTKRAKWVQLAHSNKVTARWVLDREVARRQPKAVEVYESDDPKFDALLEYHSMAAEHIRAVANQIVDAYLQHMEFVEDHASAPYTVGDVYVDRSQMVPFKHALHAGYSGMNADEEAFARALDATRRPWCWNPPQGGYHIPLLDDGPTDAFHPDFLVWVNGHVVVIDTKGKHLLREDAPRKLLHIDPRRDAKPSVVIRFVSRGKWEVRSGAPVRVRGGAGFSVFLLRMGKLAVQHADTLADAVVFSLATAEEDDDGPGDTTPDPLAE